MTPPERRFVLLAGARRAGDDFASAWPIAVDQALEAEQGAELEDWRLAFDETRDAWDAAWGRRPQTRARRALVAVANDPDRVDLEDDELPEVCDFCDGPMRVAASPGPPRRYCGVACRRAAAESRMGAAA